MKLGIKVKIKRIFTYNLGLKVMALLFAIGLWLVVVNVDNPNQTRTFTAPVTMTNGESLAEAGRYYKILDGKNTVSFRVTARRSVIERLTSKDFTAVADMSLLEDDSRVPVTVTYNGNATNVSISAKKLYLEVEVGDVMELKKEIEVSLKGTLAEGCVVSEAHVDPQVVSIRGPQDVLATIAKVVAYVDVEGMDEDVHAEKVVLHLLDKNGKEVDRSKLELDRDTTNASVTIMRVKQVDVQVSTSGTLPDGLHLDEVSVNPSKITIMGPSDKLNDVTAIVIPDSVVDLSKIHDSTSTTVDLNAYLPEGVKVEKGGSAQAQITIKVSGDSKKSFEVATSNITIRNLSEGLEASFDDAKITIELTGSKEDLAAIDPKNITGYIDASGLGEGKQTLPLTLDLDNKYAATPVTVKITIK